MVDYWFHGQRATENLLRTVGGSLLSIHSHLYRSLAMQFVCHIDFALESSRVTMKLQICRTWWIIRRELPWLSFAAGRSLQVITNLIKDFCATYLFTYRCLTTFWWAFSFFFLQLHTDPTLGIFRSRSDHPSVPNRTSQVSVAAGWTRLHLAERRINLDLRSLSAAEPASRRRNHRRSMSRRRELIRKCLHPNVRSLRPDTRLQNRCT